MFKTGNDYYGGWKKVGVGVYQSVHAGFEDWRITYSLDQKWYIVPPPQYQQQFERLARKWGRLTSLKQAAQLTNKLIRNLGMKAKPAEAVAAPREVAPPAPKANPVPTQDVKEFDEWRWM